MLVCLFLFTRFLGCMATHKDRIHSTLASLLSPRALVISCWEGSIGEIKGIYLYLWKRLDRHPHPNQASAVPETPTDLPWGGGGALSQIAPVNSPHGLQQTVDFL